MERKRVVSLCAAGACVAVLFLSSGCELSPADREDEVLAPLRNVEEELRPGLSPQAVQKLLGPPDGDFLDADNNSPVIRVLNYDALGLYLQFHPAKGLGYVSIRRRWNKSIQGLRYGDRLDPQGFPGKSGVKAFRSTTWPSAFFFFDGEGDHVKVRTIVLQDRTFYGKWSTTIKFGAGAGGQAP
jgi:hypothetical protein